MDAQDFTDVIQVCTDGSSLSEKGVTTAVELAKTLGLPLLGMTVVKGDAPENGLEGEPQEVRDRLQTIVEEAEAAGIQYRVLAEHAATPHEGILDVAMRYDARFIVMASRGLGSLGSLFLGPETQKTLAEADRPVLVIR